MPAVRQEGLPQLLTPPEAHGEARGAELQVPLLREAAQDAEVASGSRDGAHRGEALQVHGLRQRLQVQEPPRLTHEARSQDPHAADEALGKESQEE